MEYSKILVVRTDRLGDCILSTPAISILRTRFPAAAIDVLTTPYTRDVFTGNPAVREVLIDDPSSPLFSSAFLSLVKKVRSRAYDACFILHLTARAALVPFLAGVPVRVAPATKIYQFLANRRIAQKRSKCLMNEADYNSSLVTGHLGRGMDHPPASLYVDAGALASAKSFLDGEFRERVGAGLDEFRAGGGRMAVVHPGCGGSALNMSPGRYVEIMERLRSGGFAVFLSTGPAEEDLKERFLAALSFDPLRYGNETLKSPSVLKNTFALLSLADVVIAPSTGIMHAAVALGRPVVALFCPIFVCTPVRWGPDPHSHSARAVMRPEAVSTDPGNVRDGAYCERCIGSACAHFNCMDLISAGEIFDRALTFFS